MILLDVIFYWFCDRSKNSFIKVCLILRWKNNRKKTLTRLEKFRFVVQGRFQSIPNGDGTDLNSFHIQIMRLMRQPIYWVYSGIYEFTFIGYEVISPLSNFHYSTSCYHLQMDLFKMQDWVNYIISDESELTMVGAFIDAWNSYSWSS
jgi:hypothetical protein